MTNQLWSDDLIRAEIEDLSLDENSNNYLESNEKVRRLMRRMRNEYEQRIASMSREISRLDKVIAHLEGRDDE